MISHTIRSIPDKLYPIEMYCISVINHRARSARTGRSSSPRSVDTATETFGNFLRHEPTVVDFRGRTPWRAFSEDSGPSCHTFVRTACTQCSFDAVPKSGIISIASRPNHTSMTYGSLCFPVLREKPPIYIVGPKRISNGVSCSVKAQ